MSRIESGTGSDSVRQIRQARTVEELLTPGPETKTPGLGFESISWDFKSSPRDVEGNMFYGSRLGDEATAPNVFYDGVADVDATRISSR